MSNYGIDNDITPLFGNIINHFLSSSGADFSLWIEKQLLTADKTEDSAQLVCYHPEEPTGGFKGLIKQFKDCCQLLSGKAAPTRWLPERFENAGLFLPPTHDFIPVLSKFVGAEAGEPHFGHILVISILLVPFLSVNVTPVLSLCV